MLIRNAKLLLDGKITEGLSLRTANGRIAELGEHLALQPDETLLDAGGMLLSPGFVDIHIHGFGGKDTMNGKAHIVAMQRGLVKRGVTGFLPTTMADDYDKTRAALCAAHELMSEPFEGSRVLGCHLEGPFLNPAKKGAQPEQYIFPPSKQNYLRIAQGHESAVKLMTIAPEMPGALELIAELSGSMALSAGHTDATLEQMRTAADAGITQVTHLFNGMNALTHRAPGVPGAALTDERIRVQIIADLLHLHPMALNLAWRAKGAKGCCLITDAMEATDMPDGQYMLGANHVTVANREARLADGSLAGSTLTMDRAVKNMVEGVGVPLEDALYMATTAPADAIGEAERGRIAKGAHADFVLLSPDICVEKTIVAGKVAYERQ